MLQACLIIPDMIAPTFTSGITTWTTVNTPGDGDFLIEGDLTIESGATLVINAGVTVHFGEQSRVIIKPNGLLILYGTLTAMSCKGYTWPGVKVWGSSAVSQQSQYVVNGARAQGRIECFPGALIENARTGVELYGPTPTFTGGQIYCNGATIKNCINGVVFAVYQNFWPFSTPAGQYGQPRNYFGSFSGATFITDNDYPHPDSFDSFVKMTGVDGVTLSGCSMVNTRLTNGSNESDWGYGIHATDAGFNVTPKCEGNPVPYPGPCESYKYPEFTGLGYGVYAGSAYTGKPYIVREAVFSNCFIGIHNRSVGGGTIIFNTFKMGEIPSTEPTSDQVGVVFDADVPGFTCEENTFVRTTTSSAITTIGTICINTGAANKTIRRNTFTGLSIGNLANGANAPEQQGGGFRGVYYDCNTNFDVVPMEGKDISVPDPDGRIKLRQGLEMSIPPASIVYGPAGNGFSYTGIDISNIGTQFRYYYGDGQNHDPMTIEGNVLTTYSMRMNPCLANYCAPPCKTAEELVDIKSGYYAEKDAYETVKSSYILAPNDEKEVRMSYHQRKMDEGAYIVVVHTLYDTVSFHIDTLRTWIGNLGSPEGDLWLANEHLKAGNSAAGIGVLNSMSSKYQLTGDQQTDIEDYRAIFNILTGHSVYSLDINTLESVFDYLDAKGYAGAWAKNIASLYGKHFPPYYIKEGQGVQLIQERLLHSAATQEEFVKVFPNPAKELVNFALNLPQGSAVAHIRIYDLNGRLIKQQSELEAKSIFVWHTDVSPAGIYYYILTAADGSIQQRGKLILSK